MSINTLISCILAALLVVLADSSNPSALNPALASHLLIHSWKWLAWISLNMTVPKQMTDWDYVNAEVPVLVGSPPQTVSMTVGLAEDLLAAWSTDCAFCPGYTPFDPQLSSTLKVSSYTLTWTRSTIPCWFTHRIQNENKSWPRSNNKMSGSYVSDIFSFGGIVDAPQNQFGASY